HAALTMENPTCNCANTAVMPLPPRNLRRLERDLQCNSAYADNNRPTGERARRRIRTPLSRPRAGDGRDQRDARRDLDGCPQGASRRRRACPSQALIVEQEAPRRGVDVIELAGTHRPAERDHGARDDEQGEGKDDVEHCHELPLNARERRELASTVSELAGISSAAINGWMTPAIASEPAIKL